MSLPRLDPLGTDFTVTKWNDLIDSLESQSALVLGRGVVTGLVLSVSSGLQLAISDGSINSRNYTAFTSIPLFNAPPNDTRYVYINESGTVTSQATPTPPSSDAVCLGQIITNGVAITSINDNYRDWIQSPVSSIGQAGGYIAVTLSNVNVTLLESQYQNRVIEFTGVLTGNVSVSVPVNAGGEWTVIDSTTGAFTVTFKTTSGTGIVLAHTKTCKVFSDGTNVRRATADV